MSSAIADLAANITAKTDHFHSGIAKASRELSLFGKAAHGVSHYVGEFTGGLKGLAVSAISAAFSLHSIESAFERIEQLARGANILGMKISDLQAIGMVARDTATPMEAVTTGLQKLNKALGEGAGNAQAQIALEVLGLDFKRLLDLSPADRLAAIADKFKLLETAETKAAVATALFGRGGQEMIPMLDRGGEAFRTATETINKFGTGISKASAEHVEDAIIALKKLKGAFNQIAMAIAVEVAPVITMFAGYVLDLVKWVKGLWSSLSDTQKQIALLGAAFVGWLAVIPGIVAGIMAIVVATNAMAVAQATVAALSGPAGWIALAAAAVAAGGTYYFTSKAMAEATKKLKEHTAAGEKNKTTFDDVAKEHEALAKHVREHADAVKEAAAAHKRFLDEGAKITESVRTPIEIYADRVHELGKYLDGSAISMETYARAIEKAKDEFKSATKASDEFHESARGGVGAVSRGTTAAFSAVESARRESERSRDVEKRTAIAAEKMEKHLSSIDAKTGAPREPVSLKVVSL